MKKIIALLFCFLFVLTACSDKTNTNVTELNEENFASYVGAGEMTLINILVNSNAGFVNDVFIKKHLAVDEKAAITNDLGTFAPVISDSYKTLADLRAHLSSTYTESTVESVLNGHKEYVDIDGKLYLNTNSAATDYGFDWSSPSISATIGNDGKYEIKITIKDSKGKDYDVTAYAVTENGSLKLENIYY